jgi:hypothetical protein
MNPILWLVLWIVAMLLSAWAGYHYLSDRDKKELARVKRQAKAQGTLILTLVKTVTKLRGHDKPDE